VLDRQSSPYGGHGGALDADDGQFLTGDGYTGTGTSAPNRRSVFILLAVFQRESNSIGIYSVFGHKEVFQLCSGSYRDIPIVGGMPSFGSATRQPQLAAGYSCSSS
jgi:hypothetical protein